MCLYFCPKASYLVLMKILIFHSQLLKVYVRSEISLREVSKKYGILYL